MKRYDWRSRPLLGAAYRSPYFSLTVVSDRVLIEIHRGRERQIMRREVERLLADYPIEIIVFEPNGENMNGRGWNGNGPARVMRLRLREAKREFLGNPSRTNRELFLFLLGRYPKLRRFIRQFRATGRLPMTKRWKTVILISVAVALAAEQITKRRGPYS